MLCDNCGKREADVRYSENINVVKKELHLCDICSEKLGITQEMSFNLPTFDFSNFFSGFFEDFGEPKFMPLLNEVKQQKCDSCGTIFEDIINTGKYGCPNCYDVFQDKMDPILKRLQGANRHTGRLGKVSDNHIKFEEKENDTKQNNSNNKDRKLEKLENDLKQAIKEERYEDAAKLRDEIKKHYS